VAHHRILRSCLPDTCLKLFQCRINKKAWKDKRIGEVERDDIAIALHESDRLSKLSIARPRTEKNFFPSTASLLLTPGSFVLEMTTQEGRTATVIFPPGPKSLEDIQYMLGAASESPPVHVLKRFAVSPSGDAKCLMHVIEP
jgi:hypothetical protein